MIHLLFVFLYLAQIVQGASNTTSSSCPPTDGTLRSVWSILGSCALTLLICVWQAIHPEIPPRKQRWNEIWQGRLIIVTMSFFFPEGMIFVAARQWRDARRKVEQFRGMSLPPPTVDTQCVSDKPHRKRLRMVDDAQPLRANGRFCLLRRRRQLAHDQFP